MAVPGEVHVLGAIAAAEEAMDVTLKDKQREAVVGFMKGSDVFVSFPTGYGKSMVYAILPPAFDHLKGLLQSHTLAVCLYLWLPDHTRRD